MHIVLRLRDDPLHIYDTVHDEAGRSIGTAVIGGARAVFYIRDVSRPACSVGALLHPGAALPLLGVPAEALAERHTALDDLWGAEVNRIRERLLALQSPSERLELFEAVLARRLPRLRAIHPVVAHALQRFGSPSADIRTVVQESGYSHRRFITLFREAVGLAPKRYCRILRFQHVLHQLEAMPSPEMPGAEMPGAEMPGAEMPRPGWSQLALAAGFSDQAHLVREFREFAGVTPTQFERLAPRHTHHVPVVSSNSFKTGALKGSKLRS
jgi:AraC-like DNA-binding protein